MCARMTAGSVERALLDGDTELRLADIKNKWIELCGVIVSEWQPTRQLSGRRSINVNIFYPFT